MKNTNNYFHVKSQSKKKKYIDQSSGNLNGTLPGIWNFSDYNHNIDDETKLRSKASHVNKTNVYSTNHFHPNNYNVGLKAQSGKKNLQINRLPGTNYGPGRGFGNIDILNDLRTGNCTRLDTNQWKKEKEQVVNDRFEYLTRNVQNPNNIVLPFPRGGEMTRKLSTTDKKYEDNIEFKY